MEKYKLSCLYCKNKTFCWEIKNKQLFKIYEKDKSKCIKCIIKKYVPKIRKKTILIKNDLYEIQKKIDFISRRISLL
jgi:hypothetical protein